MFVIFQVPVYPIKKYNVEAMFLQIIAARFLEAKQNKNKVTWHVMRSDHLSVCLPYRHQIYEFWDGINVIEENKV